MFGLNIDLCLRAKNNWGIGGENCVTDGEKWNDIMPELSVNVKVVNKFFNPSEYYEKNEMDYKESTGLSFQFLSEWQSLNSVQFVLEEHKVDYWMERFLATCNFPQFFEPHSLNYFEP